MRVKTKWLGLEAQIRTVDEHKRRIAITVLLASILVIVAISAYFNSSVSDTNRGTNQNSQQTTNRTFSFKAAIIDHLSISDPNPYFIEESKKVLEAANFTVDYYPREQVTIDFYKTLATKDYGLIIFRVHSGHEPVAFFFSGEQYSTEHFNEQWNNEVGQGQVPGEELTYFTIRPSFVKYSMKGTFYKTVIIAMGCGSLHTTSMAEAFIEKGAAVYMGWNSSLYAFHGDLATQSVIEHLLLQRQTVKEAVDAAMEEVGPCQTSESGTISVLSFHRLDAGNYTIPYAKQ